ncbi:MAG: RND transporter, partial [Burkholderia sp.]|uniref:hypothetical protein n=1 Tax=Burkholderia sp. TaxID=36773 RepID=UPI0033900D1E|nr:RND transporter [Burkholderia sp.]
MRRSRKAAGSARGVKGGSMIAAAVALLALSGCVPSGFLPSLSLRAPADDALAHTTGPGAN